MAKKKGEESYDGGPVGYRKPPSKHQFKKGMQKPKGSGRQKGVKNVRLLIKTINSEEKLVTLEGKRQAMTRHEIMLRDASQKAMTGSMRDKINYVQLCEMLAPGSIDPPEAILVESMPGDEGL